MEPESRDSDAKEVGHAAVRGAVAAMAMTGMRQVTEGFGLVKEAPPKAIFRQKTKGLIRLVPRGKRRGMIELFHWGYGAAGGALFGALPDNVRRSRWGGPLYGLLVWVGFEAGVAPLLGLKQADEARPVDRAALAADHLLYGLVLSERGARRPG
jgi:hypothetical protein